MTRTRKLLIGLASAAVVVAASAAAPASAADRTFTDQKDDVKGGFDIHAVRVVHTGNWIKIRTHHRNLRYGTAQSGGISVYINTVRNGGGPEFRFSGPIGFDGDYGIVRVRHWKPIGDPLSCQSQRYRVNYKRDVVAFAVTRGCLARAIDMPIRGLRVAAKTAQSQANGAPRIDWAPKRHKLYPVVHRG